MRYALAALMTTSLITSVVLSQAARADSLRSYCTYTPNDEGRAVAMPCTFSQRQGIIGISWDDGVYNRFEPIQGSLGTYLDQRGGLVYRQRGGSDADLVFKMEAGDIVVYWGDPQAND